MGSQISSAPAALVNDKGEVTAGVFAGACQQSNLERAVLHWAGLRLPPWLAALRLKRWQHFACVLPEAFLGLAIVDLGWMRASWCHFRDRRGGEPVEHARRSPLLDLQLAAELWQDRSWARARGYSVEIENRLQLGEHRLSVAIDKARGRSAIHASLLCRQDLQHNCPLVVCMPVAPDRFMYSHKAVLPLEGDIELAMSRTKLHADPARSFAILDVHKAYYPRHSQWEWATFAGRDGAGRWLGLNLTRNTNPDDELINENALWMNGAIQHLGPAQFEHSRKEPMSPWRMRTADGKVDLMFAPEAGRHERLRLGVVRSVFHQLQGQFRGSVRFGEQALPVEGLFGLCEDHDSLW